ncbi:MAG: phosphoribosylformylglycinamidine synthase I [Candidatus Omnitrophica bacterium]|nr:phosphoribosylformylglycinamidine synthase I [Candidatus Omnitrophota bacterium]MDD5236867.1 phosphoribosylformylglycinamidine synthase I [Candidatus Omnitrophota bacterium]MDD5611257.1 phosphoribosylformylglycinamidine synthase I [Candidatus Omnitrophota bacterium]
MKPKVLILRTAGTNCDKETAFAFEASGADVELLHINALTADKKRLSDFQILAIPGGFSYGDDIAAGKILANELKYKLQDELKNFIQDGKLIIGICNGYQILVKAGILPGNSAFRQEVTLSLNDSAKFEDRWVYLKRAGKCVWTKDLPEIIYLPVAHGEGKFIARDKTALDRLIQNGQVVFQYCNKNGELAGYPDNPNGSEMNIAGITDETGRIFGLMPHPERHFVDLQDPRSGQKEKKGVPPDGAMIFRNGVEYVKKSL